tara:strand:- start:916 stop:1053 length:138 start_codon:yes stop_codon:yes gene_type:complete
MYKIVWENGRGVELSAVVEEVLSEFFMCSLTNNAIPTANKIINKI